MATSASAIPVLGAVLVHEKPSAAADRIAADSMPDSGVRIVSPSECKAVALCLAEAFRTDGVTRYSFDTPDRAHWTEEQKFVRFVQMFEYLVYAHCLNGLVLTVGPDYDCVAMWNPPGTSLDGLLTWCRSGLWRLYYQFSWEGRIRYFQEFLPLLHHSFDEILGGRSTDTWYLNYIGTKPGSRGKGYARKLMEYVTVRADRDKQVCYLESSSDINTAIYAKMGFELKKPIHLERGEERLKMDVMLREPAKAEPAEQRKPRRHFGNTGFKGD